MKFWTRLCFAFVAAAIAGGAGAAVVKLRFTGSLNEFSGGEPFSFEMVYDTALNTNQKVALTGHLIDDSFFAQNDFYGYSKAGILSTSFTFDGTTWTVDDLAEIAITSNLFADFFLDADIATDTPTRAALQFFHAQILFVGSLYSRGLGGPRLLYLDDGVLIAVDDRELYGPFSVSREVLASEVPEPSSMALVALALVGLGAGLRRRTRA